MIIEKIVEGIINWSYDQNGASKKSIKKTKEDLIQKIHSTKNYISVNYQNGKIKKLVIAEFSNTPFELDRIQVVSFILPEKELTTKGVKKELCRIRDFFRPKKLKLVLAFYPEHEKLHRTIKKIGFKLNGIKLKGSVNKSYHALKKSKLPILPEGFLIRYMNFKNDIDQVMKIEHSAHKNEPSSVVHKLPRKHWVFFRDFLKRPANAKTAFVLEYNGEIIGFAAHNKKEDLMGNSMIATISINPMFKGEGLSKQLYLKVLEDMSKRKIKEYYGFSKTKQVLKFSKKIKRSPMLYSYVLDKDSIQKL